MGRTIAIGDIHGCFLALRTIIDQINPSTSDKLIFLGDYIDRGPDSAKVVQFLMDLKADSQTVFLRGNHEIMMLRGRKSPSARRMWTMCGGNATLDSYDKEYEVGGLISVPDSHWEFFEACQLLHPTEDFVFVHGCYDGNNPEDEQLEDDVCWRSVHQIVPPESGKKIICGHTSQKAGQPLVTEHAICIDTWVYGNGWLTALDVDTNDFWQSNQYAETKTGNLSAEPSV